MSFWRKGDIKIGYPQKIGANVSRKIIKFCVFLNNSHILIYPQLSDSIVLFCSLSRNCNATLVSKLFNLEIAHSLHPLKSRKRPGTFSIQQMIGIFAWFNPAADKLELTANKMKLNWEDKTFFAMKLSLDGGRNHCNGKFQECLVNKAAKVTFLAYMKAQ